MTILPTPSTAIPPRSGQPGTGIAPPRSCQAARIPTPQADPSQASAGNSASSGVSAPPSYWQKYSKITDAEREADLRRVFRYEPETGFIIRKVKLSRKTVEGSIAGGINFEGYISVIRLGKSYRGHRLAWFLHYGVWPSEFIDHVNLNRADNRLCNLREATASQNMANRVVRRGSSLPKGVKHRNGQFYAAFKHNKITYYGPDCATPDEAVAHYLEMARAVHGDFARVEIAQSEIDPAFFAAWRETQGQTVDAETR